jgi:two-component system chemotaxis sensor kinase CheA
MSQHDEAMMAFIIECRELLDSMEEALLLIEQQPDDAETINAIFRAAHTIKGSAGIFGLDHIVSFTHAAESVLDEVRRGRIRFDASLSSLMLGFGDQVRWLVECLDKGEEPEGSGLARGAELQHQLEARLADLRGDTAAAPPATAAVAGQAPTTPTSVAPGCAHTDHWHISIRFGGETIRDGFDPLSFLRFLGTFGHIERIVTLGDTLPRLSALEPDDCHLGFEISFKTDADKATIESAFEFVREESQLRILPPHSKVHDYIALMPGLNEPDLRLGEILVRCGSLTQAELDSALDHQTTQAMSGEPIPALGTLLVKNDQVHPVVVDAALVKQTQARDARQPDANLLRVDAAKLDHLIDLVGELIIAGAGAALVARKHKMKDLIQATSAVASLMEEVRDSALNLRMMQIGGTFNRFQRMVRDVSQELGKDIVLKITGSETELDKTVIEKLADPLTHLVRNAMDHGIESEARRAQAGKPLQGTVHLHAFHEAGHVVVEVGDDGGGLPKDRILQKGIERGLVAADANLSDQDIYQLIFAPGFSTAETISNLSGRGVGMDVVKRSITALRGSIEIQTREGAGTTLRIRLPLTLAIIDGFLLGVGKSSYVVPLNTVLECIELSRLQTTERDWIDLRGEVLPIIRLRELYGIEGEPGRRQNVVVVRGGDKRVGLVVDQLMGELQTVIKPLGKVFQHIRGIGGFTILGSGAVALLLDLPTLVTQVAQQSDIGFHAPPRDARHPSTTSSA